MLKRVLLLINNESDVSCLIKSAKELKKHYSCKIDALYVKDLRKHEIIPPSIEGMSADVSSQYLAVEWDKIENAHIRSFEEKLKKELSIEIIVKEGLTPDIVTNKMKGYDLLITGIESSKISEDVKDILKVHKKPIIILKKEPINLSKPLFANDKSSLSNKSLFEFMNVFNKTVLINSIAVDLKHRDDSYLKDYMHCAKIKFHEVEREGDKVQEIESEAAKNTILIMGSLSHNYLVERITGHIGVKLIEKLDIPIFIA